MTLPLGQYDQQWLGRMLRWTMVTERYARFAGFQICGRMEGWRQARTQESLKPSVSPEKRLRRRSETPRSVAHFLWQPLANAVTCPDPTTFR